MTTKTAKKATKKPESKALTLKQALDAAKVKFAKANELHLVQWEQESGYAGQALRNNPALRKCDPRSIHDSIVNLASIGISLNPAMKLAYLVPRAGKCVLDISYMGLIKIATDTGSILWAQAEVVYENDTFVYHGPTEKPVHVSDPFAADRGEKKGVYCVAKTAQGDYLTEVMTMDDIDTVRAASSARSGPWVEYWGEMAKKSVIKRASKTWPKTTHTRRLDQAIDVLNQHEGSFDLQSSGKVLVSDEELRRLEVAIAEYGLNEEIVLRAIGAISLEQLPADQFDNAMNLIRSAKAA